jgi:hypothetical protein
MVVLGRPSSYTPEMALAICERLVEGESLRAITRSEGMPHIGTVFRWMEAFPDFREQYTRAREIQAEAFADEMTEIADDASNDWMARNDPDNPGWVANNDHINRSRLRIDTRKWIASKLKPKKYGDFKHVEHSGTVSLEELITGEARESERTGPRAN